MSILNNNKYIYISRINNNNPKKKKKNANIYIYVILNIDFSLQQILINEFFLKFFFVSVKINIYKYSLLKSKRSNS